jgi:hypothetical protein
MMKKSLIFVFLLLVLPLISAVQINMNSNYSQGETLIAQISGNFLTQIQQQNVLLYNGHVRVSFIPMVQQADGTFYIYGQLLGKSPGNYSLVISGVTYSELGKTINNDITQNFTITNDTADFSVDPGFIASDNSFTINAQNLVDNSISVSSFLENSTMINNSNIISSIFGTSSSSSTPLTSTTSTQINSGRTGQISFQVTVANQDQIIFAALQTSNTLYEIPVFIPANITSENTLLPLLIFKPQQEIYSMSTGSNSSSFLLLSNSGDETQNVNLSLSNNLQAYVSLPNSVTIGSNSSILIPINITSSSSQNFIDGQISAVSPNSSTYFELILNFSSSYVAPPNGTTLFQTCAQLNGIFCSNNETCSVPTQNAQDGSCCIGTCQPIANNTAETIIIWLLVVIIIVVVIFFLFRRYKKAKRPFNLMDAARKRR